MKRILAILLALPSVASATENFETRKALLQKGFRSVAAFSKASLLRTPVLEDPPSQKNPTLEWPVTFQDPQHSIGNTMIQFQDYGGGAYYHGGCDLRTRDGEWILAPVSGRVEAFYYSYTMRPDGSAEKFTNPKNGESLYYEVAVIADDGTRHEIHHIDPSSLTLELRQVLTSANPRVERGLKLGRVITWPARGVDGQLYHHIHYNIISADGVNLNPEALAPRIPDALAPTIEKVFAVVSGRAQAQILQSGQALPEGTTEILVMTYDRKDQNVYTHATPYLSVAFSSAAQVEHNFINQLTDRNGRFPDIRQVFAQTVKASDGRTYRTQGNYQNNRFIYRLAVPAGVSGQPFRLVVADIAGNAATF